MIRQLATARPEYLVLVFTDASWGGAPTLDLPLFQWVSQFSSEHYELIGVVDIEPQAPDKSASKDLRGFKAVWGAEAASAYLAAADPGAALPVCLLQRKPPLGGSVNAGIVPRRGAEPLATAP